MMERVRELKRVERMGCSEEEDWVFEVSEAEEETG